MKATNIFLFLLMLIVVTTSCCIFLGQSAHARPLDATHKVTIQRHLPDGTVSTDSGWLKEIHRDYEGNYVIDYWTE